ncbi:MAG: toprim domain-containing protein [Candidatus Methanosuratus sp.]|nr:toprim domain-containing protein [Candidatus Methanosuratincola sp.]
MRRKKGPKHFYEVKQRISEVIQKINENASLVLVEGKNDERALRRARLKTPIITFCDSNMPRFEFVERIAGNYGGQRVVVLFDYDKEGSVAAKRMTVDLEEKGVRVEGKVREELGEILVWEGIRRVEEMMSVLSKADL